MAKAPELRENIPLPDEISNAALDGNLVLFVGAGVSRLLDLPSWQGLAECALEDLRDRGYLNYSEVDQIQTLDAKKQLSIAKEIAMENGYSLDLVPHLSGFSEGDSIYKDINNIGCSCVTTNYDELLLPRYHKVTDGSETAAHTNRVSEKERFIAKLLNEPGTVVHLHGCISKPETMVVTTKDYLEHYDHKNVKHFLGKLFQEKTVLFLGYGLEESEILEHILRRGDVRETEDRRRFAVQGFFRSQIPLYEALHGYYDKSFGVHLLGFELDHESYSGLATILRTWSAQITVKAPPLVADVQFMEEVLKDD